MEFSFVKSVLLLKANSENVHCIFNASLMILLFMDFFIPTWQFYKTMSTAEVMWRHVREIVGWSWGLCSILSTPYTAPRKWWRVQNLQSVYCCDRNKQFPTCESLQLFYAALSDAKVFTLGAWRKWGDRSRMWLLTASSLPSELTCSADSGWSHFPKC